MKIVVAFITQAAIVWFGLFGMAYFIDWCTKLPKGAGIATWVAGCLLALMIFAVVSTELWEWANREEVSK